MNPQASGVPAVIPKGLLLYTLVLGFASGLPLALSAGTLQAWLTVEGVDLTTLGWLTVLGIPYTYKFAWAPAIDRFQLGGKRGGRRRGWQVVLLMALAASTWALSLAEPMAPNGLVYISVVALMLVVFQPALTLFSTPGEQSP